MIDNRWMDKKLKEVLMIDELSIVETDKVNYTVETDMVKLVIEIECFDMSFDEFDKETGSFDGMQPKQADLSCVHALNEPHLHEIHVVPNKHEADQYVHVIKLVYGKACHLPIEIKHKAHWALKQCNMDLTLASKSYLMQLNKLAELRDGAYENTKIYKEQTKKWHDSKLRSDKDFKNSFNFKVNGLRLKKYYEGDVDKEDDEVIEFENGVT
ncbi:hypothetical protein Tco_0582984 [Tanacetum coccineum]